MSPDDVAHIYNPKLRSFPLSISQQSGICGNGAFLSRRHTDLEAGREIEGGARAPLKINLSPVCCSQCPFLTSFGITLMAAHGDIIHMTTKEHMVGIQDATQELKRLLGTHKHFWLPEYTGKHYEVCGSCDMLRFETSEQAEDYYYENIATEAVDERGFQTFLLNQAEVVEQPEYEDVRDWEMQ